MNRFCKSENSLKCKQSLSGMWHGNRFMYLAIISTLILIINYCISTWYWSSLDSELRAILDGFNAISMALIFFGALGFILMYINVKAMVLIWKLFEQKFKMYYYISGFFWWNIYIWRSWGYQSPLGMANLNITFLAYFAMFFIYTMIDGFYISRRNKNVLTVLGVLFFSLITISLTWSEITDHNDMNRMINVFGTKWDVLGYAASSMRVVCIFLWKQTILSFWKPEQAVMITKPVTVKWID